ncbi:MAG: hypothetical protein ABI759_28105 [Candidatus Solibacter sp.]
MKWNLFVCAAALASWLLLTHGAPLMTVVTGTAAAGVFNFMRRKV